MRTEIFTLSACATEEAALDKLEPAIGDYQWYTKWTFLLFRSQRPVFIQTNTSRIVMKAYFLAPLAD